MRDPGTTGKELSSPNGIVDRETPGSSPGALAIGTHCIEQVVAAVLPIAFQIGNQYASMVFNQEPSTKRLQDIHGDEVGLKAHGLSQ